MIPLLLVIVAVCAYAFHSYRSYLHKYPRGPWPLPLVGNLHQLKPANPEHTLHAWGEQYGGMYTAMLGVPTVVITDHRLIHEALVGPNAEALAGRIDGYSRNHFAHGKNGIISSDGPLWQQLRRFSLQSLRNLGFGRNLMEAKVEKHVAWLTEQMTRAVGANDYCMFDDLQLAIGSIITDVIYSRSQYDNRATFFDNVAQVDALFDVFNSPVTIVLDGWPALRHVPLFNHFNDETLSASRTHLYAYYRHIVDEHKRALDYTREVVDADDFVDAFLLERRRLGVADDDDGAWSDLQLMAIMNDLWIAGMETTITTIKWLVLFMIDDQAVQKRAREEIHRVIGTERMVTMADKSRLPYVMACVTEAQRHGNIVGFNVFHRATRDVRMSNGQTIPKDTAVLPQISSALKSKELFGADADIFRPERFLTGDGTTLDKSMVDKMTQFSLGKRQCLGESLARIELFMAATRILQLFEMTATAPLDLTPVFKPTLQPVKFNVHLELAA